MKKIFASASAIVAITVMIGIGVLAYAVRHHHAPVVDGRVQVVAAENFWGSIVSQIGGNRVQVTSILSDPTADPHLYESNARDALAISQAKIVITNGLGYDDFMSKLLQASPNSQRTVVNAATVLHITGKDANPHVWYSVARMPEIAQAIESALAQKDPADIGLFAANLKTFDASLQPLTDKINQIKAQFAGTPVAYTERVPGYLLAATGLDVKTPDGFASSIEDGSNLSPADQSAMENLITDRQITVLFNNVQATTPATEHIRMLAEAAHIPVVTVTETLPKDGGTYQQWQSNQLDALLNALGSS